MKSLFLFIVLFFAVGAIVLIPYLFNKNNVTIIDQSEIVSPQEQTVPTEEMVVGSDRDENGCIVSAGYSWCGPKSKCLRIWEEACYENVEEEIEYVLANKYTKSVEDVHVVISKQDENFAAGSVTFGAGGLGESGIFLARKEGNMWEVVFDGNGSIDCDKMRNQYGFPDTILKPNFCD